MRRIFDLSNHDAAVTDMICGGKLELFLEFIRADAGTEQFFMPCIEAMASGRRVTLVCPLDAEQRRPAICHRSSGADAHRRGAG